MKLKVLITGYPGSGTSFLCNLIYELGFSAGSLESLKGSDNHNRYGYYENLVLRKFLWNYFDLNKVKLWRTNQVVNKSKVVEDLLASNKKFTQSLEEVIDREFIEVYKDNKLPIFFEAFPKTVNIIVIERNPIDVFESPQKGGHSPMSVSYAKQMLLKYWTPKGRQASMGVSYDEFLKVYSSYRELCVEMSKTRRVLFLKYEDFYEDFDSQVKKITTFLALKSSKNLQKIFKPRKSKKITFQNNLSKLLTYVLKILYIRK